MNNIANVEYFYTKCNSLLGTNYTSNDWGGEDNKKKAINIEWTVLAVNKVYQKIHQPKNGCRLLLSTRFNAGNSGMAVNEEVVNSVVTYLSKLNKKCDNDCACATDRNCACYCSSTCASNCGRMGDCANATKPHTFNCNCTTVACACNCNCNCASTDCGSNTECQCDCRPYDCNCDMITNCLAISARPYTTQCVCDQGSNCPCACECYTPPPHNSGGGGNNNPTHSSGTSLTSGQGPNGGGTAYHGNSGQSHSSSW
jgi:hypothetical protein